MARFLNTAVATLALAASFAWLVPTSESAVLAADETETTDDADRDFLPDVIEWAVLTNAHHPDSDGDGCPDFVEVVQRGNPRMVGLPRPTDHEMRLVVTSTPAGMGCDVHLHLLFRFMGEVSLLSSLDPYLQIDRYPGLRIPLGSLASGQVSFAQRLVPNEGLWVRVSIPFASEALIRTLLPCTIGAYGTIGGRQIATDVPLFDLGGVAATMVPFGPDLFAVQSINPAAVFLGGGSNRVCVLRLSEIGSGPGGRAYRVTQADCDDCNDLECGPMCPETTGWVFVLPSGVEAITGG